MKKLLFIAILILPLTVIAQRFEGGIVAGLNVSQIEGDADGGYKKAGPVGGAFVATEFQDKWGGQLEIRYAAKGSRITIDSLNSRKIKLQYIELPILATYDLKKIQFQGGLTIGYLFSAEQSDSGGAYEEFDQFDPMEFSGCLGISYKYTNRLYFNVRGAYSLVAIYAKYPGAVPPYAMFNNSLTFAAYFWFGRSYY